MECRLTHSPLAWRCQVLLRKETDENGNKVSAKEIPFGPVLLDKTQLEEMLRRAQLAILNPSLPPSFFEDFDTKSLKLGEKPPGSIRQLAFSNNVVCLDLQAPEVTDLSFIDLPGMSVIFHYRNGNILMNNRYYLECCQRGRSGQYRGGKDHGPRAYQGKYADFTYNYHARYVKLANIISR